MEKETWKIIQEWAAKCQDRDLRIPLEAIENLAEVIEGLECPHCLKKRVSRHSGRI